MRSNLALTAALGVFVVFTCLNLVKSLTETAQEDIQACREEHNATDEDLEKLKNKEVPVTQSGKCFLECVLNKFDLMSGDRLNPEGAKGMIAELDAIPSEEKDKLVDVIDECEKDIEYKEDDECGNAIIISKCISEKAEQKGIKPPADK